MASTEIKNTLCPYLVRPLIEVGQINREHVLPVGIGAPESFFVEAALSENSRLNELIDAPMVNDQLIKMLCMMADIHGRSGGKTATMHGETEVGGRFTANVSKESIDFKYRKPIEKNKLTGDFLVKGFSEEVFEEAAKIAKNMADKGRNRQGDITMLIHSKERLDMSFYSDFMLIVREAIKAAYLFTVKTYGDIAITSKSGHVFRAAFEARTEEKLRASGLYWQQLPADHYEPIVKLTAKHHMFMTSIKEDMMYTQVILFGGLSFIFWTPRDDIEFEHDGCGKLIDASKQCFIDRPED
ncbi:hypothetical protein HUW52_11760 [Pseudomonas sp. 43A]|jgi:hypothetical protein|uniref:hypothetical protein n=1 Tax=unclassified Pseudomonas TaxID=196821 RepID=UPI0015878696|nr:MULTISPECIES: hypothetical protein [unclassified Pseudomonas]QKV63528.1 hypothetical protein HUW52_11760 [Pseudomonas sp. 43A]QMW08331.1 hypothetical protein H3303_20940 [Pseudomonas sp. 29A]